MKERRSALAGCARRQSASHSRRKSQRQSGFLPPPAPYALRQSPPPASQRSRVHSCVCRNQLSPPETSSLADNRRSHESARNQRDQHRPIMRIPVSRHWKMIADHNEDHRHGHEGVLLRSQFGLSAQRCVKLIASRGGCDHLALRRKNPHPYVQRHDRPHHPPYCIVAAPPAEELKQSPRDGSDHYHGKYRESSFRFTERRPQRQIVNQPSASQNGKANGDPASLRNIRNVRVNQSAARVIG